MTDILQAALESSLETLLGSVRRAKETKKAKLDEMTLTLGLEKRPAETEPGCGGGAKVVPVA